jgi:hypothetical protein
MRPKKLTPANVLEIISLLDFEQQRSLTLVLQKRLAKIESKKITLVKRPSITRAEVDTYFCYLLSFAKREFQN